MSFGSNNWVYGLIVLVLMISIYIFYLWNRKRIILKLMSIQLFARINEHIDINGLKYSTFIFIASIIFITIALARPRYNKSTEIVKTRGSEIMIMIDVSLSMLCEDIAPNRLERAKIAMLDFVDMMDQDAIGVGKFAGEGYLLSPPSTDYDATKQFIESIYVNPNMKPGTNLESAIKTSIKGFSDKEIGKAIILITDGEGNLGDYKGILKETNEKGIRIFSIGVGSERGEPIPIKNETGKVVDYKKDIKGKLVLSKLNDNALKEIARETNGSFYNAYQGSSFSGIINSISQLKKGFSKERIKVNYGELFQIPLFIAFFLLLYNILIPIRRNDK